MNLFELYEDLKKYLDEDTERDDMFYEASEGEAQIDVIRDMLENLLEKL